MKKENFMQMRKLTLIAVVLLMVTFMLTNCSSDNDDATTETVASVQVATNTTLGKILTDKNGKTLYYFSTDHFGTQSTCTGNCLTSWPIFYDANLTVGTGLTASDFGVITNADGTKQNTYKGWPLYYYKDDTAAGQTKGEAVGNVWFVAKPDYSIMYVSAQLKGKNSAGVITDLKSDYTAGTERTFYLTDEKGRTLYAFKNDKLNTNTFTVAANAANHGVWPIAEITLDKIPSILNKADFGSITLPYNGKKQLTYKGWPLYYFQQDVKRGDNFGVGFPSPGIWPIVNIATAMATP